MKELIIFALLNKGYDIIRYVVSMCNISGCLILLSWPKIFDLLPKKVVHSKREKDSKIRKRSGRGNEEEQLHGGADRLCIEAGGAGHADIGGMPEARDCGADILPLEEQVRRDAAKRHEASAATGRRERKAEEAGG